MQQFISKAESCALLDRILQTVHSLNEAIAKYVHTHPDLGAAPAPEPIISPAIAAEPILLPVDTRPVAPVLTIKLSDLIRENEKARQRRGQHLRQPRKQKLPRQRPRIEDVEVLYRRGYRLVS